MYVRFFYDFLVTLCVPLTDATQYAAEYARVDIFDYLDHLSKVYDSSSFLFETTINMLLWDYYKGRPCFLGQQMQRLQKEGLLPHAVELNDSP